MTEYRIFYTLQYGTQTFDICINADDRTDAINLFDMRFPREWYPALQIEMIYNVNQGRIEFDRKGA